MDQHVLASIHLFGVLRNLEDLSQIDDRARQLVKGKQTSIKFLVPKLPTFTLEFTEDKCRAFVNKQANAAIHLRFRNAAHLNKMMVGKAQPIPTRGFRQLSFLTGDFTRLTDILTEYLQPTEEALIVKDFREKSTILTANTAFYAVSQIANYDKVGKKVAQKIGDGTICIRIAGQPYYSIVAKDHRLFTFKGQEGKVMGYMDFDNLETAEGILRGELDSYACIGFGKLAISGSIARIDNLNKLLNLVSIYLE